MSENTNYAIIKSGSNQQKVSVGDKVKVQLLNAEQGSEVKFEEILLVANGENVKVGSPVVKGASVTGKVVGTEKQKKTICFTHRKRKNHRNKTGHRQGLMVVEINAINA